jgi:hypothetical protein
MLNLKLEDHPKSDFLFVFCVCVCLLVPVSSAVMLTWNSVALAFRPH